MDVRADPPRQMVRLRGRSYVAFVFSPVVPIVEWLAEIDATLARSPGFFVGKPIVLDLAAVDLSGPAIAHLLGSLNERNIRVLGIEGVDEERLGAEHAAIADRWPCLRHHAKRTGAEGGARTEAEADVAPAR